METSCKFSMDGGEAGRGAYESGSVTKVIVVDRKASKVVAGRERGGLGGGETR